MVGPYFRVRLLKRTTVTLMQTLGLVVFILYVIIPLIFRFSPLLQRHMIFLPYLRWPTGVNFSSTDTHGLNATRNFYVESESGVKVGVWHMLPHSLANKSYNDDEHEKSLSEGFPIILYLHGNSGSRISSHRLELYKILQSLDYHIVTLDYRGYADSSVVLMSEDGVVTDAKAIYSYIKKHSSSSRLVVWGHSLGTGVASRAVSELCKDSDLPYGLILESPFNNIKDEIRSHPLSYIYRPIPAFDWFFTDPLKANNLAFESDLHIKNINSPILILHAQDDAVIPIFLAQKLFNSAVDQRSDRWPSVQLIEFDQSFGYGHKYICRAPELSSIIQDFIKPGWTTKSEKRLIS